MKEIPKCKICDEPLTLVQEEGTIPFLRCNDGNGITIQLSTDFWETWNSMNKVEQDRVLFNYEGF